MSATVHAQTLPLPPASRPAAIAPIEWRFFAILLLLCNLPLLKGGVAEALAFFPAAVTAGQWWRLFTFPFVHVSWYHLALDAGALLLLWHGLREMSLTVRVLSLVGCWAGNLLLPLLVAPAVLQNGLCGLSGLAHGLLAVTALELWRHSERRELRQVGGWLLLGLLAVVAWEMVSGAVLLDAWHLGPVGIPLPAAHAGGVLGGMAAFGVMNLSEHSPRRTRRARR